MQCVEALANGQANKTHRPKDASTQKLLNIINGQSLLPSQAKPNKWEKNLLNGSLMVGKKEKQYRKLNFLFMRHVGKYLDPWNKNKSNLNIFIM